MQIEKGSTGDLLEMSLSGVLDNESSLHFRHEIESCTRAGWHRIVVDLAAISYLSSAGIAALVSAKQQLDQLNGFFGIYNPTPQVESVLRQVRLLDRLRCDPDSVREARWAGSMTMALSETTKYVEAEGIEMEIYPLGDLRPLSCQVIGDADMALTFDSTAAASHRVMFDRDTLCIGLGSITDDNSPEAQVCEVLAVDGAAAQSAHTSGGLPDYSLSQEDFVPVGQLKYGIQCRGCLPTLIRFQPAGQGDQVRLSQLIRQSMLQTDAPVAAFAVLSDCAGLVGAKMRHAPDPTLVSAGKHFEVPNISRWLSFSSERLYRRNLALIVGIAASAAEVDRTPLAAFVRPLDTDLQLLGHFHCAVFPFQPIKKRTLELSSSVHTLFASGTIEDVMHLLCDSRPIAGAGESELLSGACWIGSIDRFESGEVTA